MKASKKKVISTFFKIGISLFLLYFVFTKISFSDIWATLRNVKLQFIVLAVVFFILSQWVSAKRLLQLFREVDYDISEKSNNILYLIGMFYNFFIPGGIGGDAYKIYILNKNFKWDLKTLSAVIFIDRFMGLTAIGVLIAILSYTIVPVEYFIFLFPIALILIIGISFLIVKRFFLKFSKVFSKTLLKSIIVQVLQILSVVSIIFSLEGDQLDYVSYIAIFLISSVLSVFSFSGIGVREYVFLEASLLLEIDSSNAVVIGVLFSIITAFISLIGIFYHFKSPKLCLDDVL